MRAFIRANESWKIEVDHRMKISLDVDIASREAIVEVVVLVAMTNV